MKSCGQVGSQTCWVVQARRPLHEGFREQRLHHLVFFLPPPHPPLSWTGLSRKDVRSFLDGANVTSFIDGNVCPGNTEGNRVDASQVLKYSVEQGYALVKGGFSLLTSVSTYRYDHICCHSNLQPGIFIFDIFPQSLESSCSASLCFCIRGPQGHLGIKGTEQSSTSAGYDAFHVSLASAATPHGLPDRGERAPKRRGEGGETAELTPRIPAAAALITQIS